MDQSIYKGELFLLFWSQTHLCNRPPGTGKSLTMALAVLFGLYARSKRLTSANHPTLVCAEQNKAVDAISTHFQRLFDLLRSRDVDFREFSTACPPLRSGDPEKIRNQPFASANAAGPFSVLFTTCGHFLAARWRERPSTWSALYLDEANHTSVTRLGAFARHAFEGHWYLMGGKESFWLDGA
jgi:hypothetical protein